MSAKQKLIDDDSLHKQHAAAAAAKSTLLSIVTGVHMHVVVCG